MRVHYKKGRRLKDTKNLDISTIAAHCSTYHEEPTAALTVPIFATSTFKQQTPGEHCGYDYARSTNPTRSAYESAVAQLECGEQAFAFSSGMAAIDVVLNLLDHGSHLIANEDMYGGTYRLLHQVKKQTSNLYTTCVDGTQIENIESAITDQTKMIWVESPSNPVLKIVDLTAIIALAKAYQLIVVVDNTFATPYLQKPLELGADIVIHSATKYLNGHCDVISGVAVVGNNTALRERLSFLHNASGAICSPFDSFLVMRGIKTLALRLKQQCASAEKIALFLSEHPAIKATHYPGLSSHPQYELACRQMRAFGGMVSLELFSSKAVDQFLKRLQIFTLAESLGGIQSLISHPATMTHAAIPIEQREKYGITDTLLRLSIGIESTDDLLRDLEQALS
ncbi:MAG: cystathionine beta-lyase [Coxiellaceae bacterium]|nr:cystathionine beta-lyase [Coxiellaceae bacterium]|tara:strand:- start:1431 stop:2618 length:1188 start_codon:yes stop_codon:yes gene_type:complete